MNNSTPEMSDLLIQYLDGDLSGPEKQAVEESIARDADIRAEWESLLQTRAAIRRYGLQQKVGRIHVDMMDELGTPVRSIPTGRRTLRYALAIAASIVLILGAFFAYNFFTLSANKVFSSNYRVYELQNLRAGDLPGDSPLETAYRDKKYNEVIRLHESGNDNSIQGEFLTGISAMETHDDPLAIRCFREILFPESGQANAVLRDESEYYLALSYIRNGDYDLALPLLNQIRRDPKHTYHSAVDQKLIWKVKLLKWR